MKIIIVLLCLLPIKVFSQFGKVHYRQIINLNGKADSSEAVLRFNGAESVYQYGSQTGKDKVTTLLKEENSEHLRIRDEKGFIFYADHQRRLFLSREFLLSKPVIVQDQFEDISWNLGEANGKLINGRLCFPAKGVFRGREYIAWYDPSLKMAFGPWKLNGLPGLIIQAHSVDEVVKFEFINYQLEIQDINPPQERTKLTQLQFVDSFKKKLKSLEKFVKSNSSVTRSMNVQSNSKIHVLEISLYED